MVESNNEGLRNILAIDAEIAELDQQVTVETEAVTELEQQKIAHSGVIRRVEAERRQRLDTAVDQMHALYKSGELKGDDLISVFGGLAAKSKDRFVLKNFEKAVAFGPKLVPGALVCHYSTDGMPAIFTVSEDPEAHKPHPILLPYSQHSAIFRDRLQLGYKVTAVAIATHKTGNGLVWPERTEIGRSNITERLAEDLSRIDTRSIYDIQKVTEIFKVLRQIGAEHVGTKQRASITEGAFSLLRDAQIYARYSSDQRVLIQYLKENASEAFKEFHDQMAKEWANRDMVSGIDKFIMYMDAFLQATSTDYAYGSDNVQNDMLLPALSDFRKKGRQLIAEKQANLDN